MRRFLTTAAVGLGAVALFTLAATSCGDDDAGAAVALDPAKADTIAHQIVIQPADLPGSGWVIASTDEFGDDAGIPANTAECRALEAAKTKVEAAVDAGRAGRAKVELSRPHPSGLATEVSTTVNIFKDVAVPTEAFALGKAAYTDENVTNCFRDALIASLGAGSKVSARSAAPLASVPEGGVARAVEISIEASGQKLQMRFEVYYWRFENAGLTVTVTGAIAELSKELSTAAVSHVQDGLVAAAK